MDSQNVKVYLAISGALIVLLILVIIIPFTKQKPVTSPKQQPVTNLIPTTVETNQSPVTNNQSLTPIPADFTGAIDEKIPQQVIDLAAQKKDLRSKVPLSLSTFAIDFDYGEDKFTVTLKEPKDQSQKEFESWRTTNYPGLGVEQFLIR